LYQDVSIELRRADGTVLFQGIPSNVSRLGLGVAVEHAIEWPESLQIRLFLAGVEQPIEATGRLVWQRCNPAAPWRS
jgi:hypothetical protein